MDEMSCVITNNNLELSLKILSYGKLYYINERLAMHLFVV